MSYYPFKSFSL